MHVLDSNLSLNLVITKNHFSLLYAIGKGGFGRVWRCTSKRGDEEFAMKEMSKRRIVAKKSVHSVLNERNLLAKLYNKYAGFDLTV